MPEEWLLLRSEAGEPAWNMAVDEALLLGVEKPTLRFYSWKTGAATFGYFQRYEEVSAKTPLRPLIRRCTGGGLVPHDCDWTYSLIIPTSHEWFALKADESYRRVHEWIARSIGPAATLADCCVREGEGSCFIGYEKSDVLLDGRKIAGAAQRRNRLGLMIQGSIQPPDGGGRRPWEERFLTCAPAEINWMELELSGSTGESADRLMVEKYGVDEYNRRR